MPFPEAVRLSPNRAPGPHEGLGVLFHHSNLDFEATIERMRDPASQVSYHALIGPDGARCTLVPDREIAWHAGASRFQGRERCNDFLMGLAFSGNTYREPLTGAQIASALEWLGTRWEARAWTCAWMTDHRQVSPARKNDLAPPEWERLLSAIASRFAEQSLGGRFRVEIPPAPEHKKP